MNLHGEKRHTKIRETMRACACVCVCARLKSLTVPFFASIQAERRNVSNLHKNTHIFKLDLCFNSSSATLTDHREAKFSRVVL